MQFLRIVRILFTIPRKVKQNDVHAERTIAPIDLQV